MIKRVALALALIGLGVVGTAHAEAPIEIGMPMALTGYLAAFDSHAADGAKLAARLLNANGGGPGGHPIELRILDNSSNATTGVTIVNELIYKHDVAAIASGALSAQTVAIEPIVTRNKLPVVTMSIIPPNMQWTFSIALPPAKLLDLELGFAGQQLKAKRIAFLYSQTPYGQIAAGIVADMAKRHGLEAVFNEGVAVAATDLTPQLARLQDSKPDAIVDFLTGPVHIVEAKAATTVGLNIPIVMAIDDTTTFQQAVGVYHDCYFVMSPIQTYPDVPDPEVRAATKRFLDAFQAAGLDPSELGTAGQGWDLVHLYAQVFAAAGPLRGAPLREALMHLDYIGAYGRYQFRADDHTGQDSVPVAMQITRFQDGRFQIVGAGPR